MKKTQVGLKLKAQIIKCMALRECYSSSADHWDAERNDQNWN